MELKGLLIEKKAAILSKWFDLILESYPSDTSTFLKKQKNQFANPVGHTISEGIEGLFDGLLKEVNSDSDGVSPFLDNIIRVRAIQDFTPSEAIGFIFLLKKVIRESLQREIREHQMYDELLRLESRIDDLVRSAFNVYMKCREQVYELKANEVKKMTFRLLQRANLVKEIQED
ncbi:MAG TPA: hypothetical protein ENI58_00730 [Nitrospirae bacterium]|nr:hypothetical protein [Nitrospirota bacterium]